MVEVTVEQCPFVVGEKPHCLVDSDVSKPNSRFIETISPEYFSFLADSFADQLEGPNKQHAAIALRAAYGQGLETFFALLFAAFQSPECIVGWVLRYFPADIIGLIDSLQNGRAFHTRVVLKNVSWEGIVELMHSEVRLGDDKARAEILKNVVRLWKHFAADYANKNRTAEYNSIKHGLRVSPGSFSLSFTVPANPREGRNEDQHVKLGGHGFGSSFVSVQSLQKKTHFRLIHRALNWHPDNLIASLHLLRFSLQNTQAFIRLVNGDREGQFSWPSTSELFEQAWKIRHGALHSEFDDKLSIDEKDMISEQEILDSYTATN